MFRRRHCPPFRAASLAMVPDGGPLQRPVFPPLSAGCALDIATTTLRTQRDLVPQYLTSKLITGTHHVIKPMRLPSSRTPPYHSSALDCALAPSIRRSIAPWRAVVPSHQLRARLDRSRHARSTVAAAQASVGWIKPDQWLAGIAGCPSRALMSSSARSPAPGGSTLRHLERM